MDNKVDDVPNISGYTIASVLMQFLALMFFFLSLAGFMTGSIIGGVILVALGGLCEFLFVMMIKKILFWKKKEKEGIAQSPVETVFAGSLYRNDGESYETARRLYCEQHGKKAPKNTMKMKRRKQKRRSRRSGREKRCPLNLSRTTDFSWKMRSRKRPAAL